MRRKIAVMVCAALMTAMLGACGGSTGASSGQAEAPAETAAEEAAPAAEEAAPEAAAEEAAPAAALKRQRLKQRQHPRRTRQQQRQKTLLLSWTPVPVLLQAAQCLTVRSLLQRLLRTPIRRNSTVLTLQGLLEVHLRLRASQGWTEKRQLLLTERYRFRARLRSTRHFSLARTTE